MRVNGGKGSHVYSSLKDRVVQALIKHLRPAWQGGGDPRDVDIDNPHVDFVELVEVAIEAMREPTEAMVENGEIAIYEHMAEPQDWTKASTKQGWQAMIDETLK